MEFKTIKVEKFGRMVHSHQEMDDLRRSQCLCLNCTKLGACEIAKEGLAFAQNNDVAFALTRCPVFEDKNLFLKASEIESETLITVGS